MQLRETIMAGHSKANCTRIVKWIGSDPLRFDQLVTIFLKDEYVAVQRAGWPLSDIVKNHPGLVQKHLKKILTYAKKPGHHESVKRNTVRLLQYIDIPEKFHGDVMNLCFDAIITPEEKPAVKAFSLSVLQKLSRQYPDIKQELKTIIEDRWDFETAAFHSRARKILREING